MDFSADAGEENIMALTRFFHGSSRAESFGPGPRIPLPDLAALGLSVLAAAAVQAIYWVRVDPPLHTDYFRYVFMAQSWLKLDFRHALNYHYTPLFPLALSAALPFAASGEAAARGVCLAFHALTAIPVYFLARAALGRRVGLAALVLYPFKFFFYPFTPLQADPRPLFNLLLFFSLYLGFLALKEEEDNRKALFASALFGISTLSKWESQAFFFFFLGIIALRWSAGEAGLKKAALRVALCFLIYVAVLSPYLGRYYLETGRLTLNTKAASLYFGHNEPNWWQAAYGLQRDERGFYTPFHRVIAQGDHNPFPISLFPYIFNYFRHLVPLYFHHLLSAFLGPLPEYLKGLFPPGGFLAALIMLAGLITRNWSRDRKWGLGYLWALVIFTILVISLFKPWSRYFVPLMPAFVILFADGLDRLAAGACVLVERAFPERLNPEKTRSALLGVFLLLAVTPEAVLLFRLPPEKDFHLLVQDRKEIAQWLKPRLQPQDKIMSHWGRVPYWYLLGILPERDLFTPYAPAELFMAYAKQERVKFIVLETGPLFREWPYIQPFLNPETAPSELKLVHRKRGFDGRIYLVYRLLLPD